MDATQRLSRLFSTLLLSKACVRGWWKPSDPKLRSPGLCQALPIGKKKKSDPWQSLSSTEAQRLGTPLRKHSVGHSSCINPGGFIMFLPTPRREVLWEEGFQSRHLPIQSQLMNHRCCDIERRVSFPCVKVSLTWLWGTAGQHSLDHLRELNWRTNVHLVFAICCFVLYVVQLGKQIESSNEVYVVYPHKLQHQLNFWGFFKSVYILTRFCKSLFILSWLSWVSDWRACCTAYYISHGVCVGDAMPMWQSTST